MNNIRVAIFLEGTPRAGTAVPLEELNAADKGEDHEPWIEYCSDRDTLLSIASSYACVCTPFSNACSKAILAAVRADYRSNK